MNLGKKIILGFLKTACATFWRFLEVAAEILIDPFLIKLSTINLALSGLMAANHLPFHIFWLWNFLFVFVVLWTIFFLLLVMEAIKTAVSAGNKDESEEQ